MREGVIKGLTPRQIRAAAALANPENDRRTKQDICADLHLSPDTLTKWLRQEEFLAEMRRIARKAATAVLPRVYSALAKKAIEGSPQAIKILLTHFDGYTERTATDLSGQVATGVTLQFSMDELSPEERAAAGDLGGGDELAALEVGEEPGDAV